MLARNQMSDDALLDQMSDDELWDWWQAKRLWEKKAPAAAAAAEEAPKKAMQKGMEKAAAPAEEAHKKAMQKGMKKKAVSTEKAHWKSLKKRMKRAITRRAPGEPPPKKPRQKGTLKNHIIRAKKANWRNLLRCDVAGLVVQPVLQDEPRRSRDVWGPSLAENRPKNDPKVSGQITFLAALLYYRTVTG